MHLPDSTSACFARVRQLLAEGQPRQAAAALARLEPAAPGSTAAQIRELLQRRVDEALVHAPARAVAAPAWAGASVLQADQGEPLPGISIVSACMNREGNLLKVLPSWLDAPVDEIVIVDWSSREPLWPQLAHLRDPRLRVVRVDDEPRWVLTHAFNVGLRLARHERVYKLDADIELRPGFFDANRFAPGEFVRGFWKAALDSGAEDQVYVNGSFGALKADLRSIGYYDERILTYGWDDSDLYHRLVSCLGRAGQLLALGSLQHLAQPEQERIANQSIATTTRLGRFSPTDHENQVNRFHTATRSEWSAHHWTQDYGLSSLESGLWLAKRMTNRPQYVAAERVLAETLATREMSAWLGPLLPPETWPHPDSLELARLVRQADRSGRGAALMTALRERRALHIVRAADAAFRNAACHTVQALRSHSPSMTNALVIVEDDGFCPEAVAERNAGSELRASAALLDVIGRVVGAEQRTDIRGLPGSAAGDQAACTVWAVNAEQTVKQALALADSIRERIAATLPRERQRVAHTCLVVSLYDEPNLIRLTEYLACLRLNLEVFDSLVVVYEHRDGLLLRALPRMVEHVPEAGQRLRLVPCAERPRFQHLFEQQALLGPGTLLAVANADVVFDTTLLPLRDAMSPEHVAVLSRRELPPDGSAAALLRTVAGVPNVFSADAWLVKTPFEAAAPFDYVVGSFYCDSFMNGRLGRQAGCTVVNPCLDTHLFHVHDARFNSSDEKKHAQRAQLEAIYVAESERVGDPDPIKGVAWSTVEQMAVSGRVSPVCTWTPLSLVVDLSSGPPGLAGLVWLWLLGRQLQWMQPRAHLFARLRPQDAAGPFGLLWARVNAAEGLDQVMLDIAEPGASPPAMDAAHVRTRQLDGRQWLAALKQGGLDQLVGCITQALAADDAPGGPGEIRVDIHLPQDTFATQELLAVVEARRVPHWAGLRDLLRALPPWLAEQKLLSPFLPDLDASDSPAAPGAPAVRRGPPRVAFVTSMFRGGPHTAGYLENVAAAAERADGEVIIVDANGGADEADSHAVDSFLARHPSLRSRFLLLKPERDPGLYACWRMAIEHARAPLLTNANLDDRRSPGHTQRLAGLLDSRPDLSAVCGALTVVRDDEQGGWFDLIPNETWFGEPGLREFGHGDLFRRADDGTVMSQNMLHCMPVWRRSLHDRWGWFDEERYGTSADWAFWLRIGQDGCRFALDPQAWGRYFFNPSSHNRRNDADGSKERRIISELIGVQQSHVVKQ